MARHGCGGGTASAIDAIRNKVPRTSRSAAAAYFARKEVVVRRQGGGNKGNNNGGNDGGGDVIALVVTREGVVRCNEKGRGEVEDVVITATGMPSRGGWAVDGATKGGADDARRLCWYGDKGMSNEHTQRCPPRKNRPSNGGWLSLTRWVPVTGKPHHLPLPPYR
jgi:hypothetical protein